MAETKPSYLKIIPRWFVVAFAVFVLTVLGGVYVTSHLPKVYNATAQIQIRQEDKRLGDFNGGDDHSFDPTAFQAQFETLQSPDVLLPIITDLKLDQTWATREKRGDKLTPLESLAYLKSALKLDLKRGTNIVEITASSEDPQEAATIANAIADRYKTLRDVQEDQRNHRGADYLREQVDQQQKVVDEKKAAADKAQQDLQKAGVTMSEISAAKAPTTVDLEDRKKDLLRAKVDYDARRVLWQQVQNLPDEEFVNTLSALGRQEPNIAALRTEIFSRQGDIDNLLKDGFDEKHPRVQALHDEIARKQQQIKDLVGGTRRAMQIDVEMAQSRVTLLQKEVDELSAKASQKPDPQLEPYRAAQRDYEQQLSILEAYKVRLKQIESENGLLESPVRIITRAQAPEYPSSPKKALYLVMSVALGLFLGPLVATIAELGLWVLRRTQLQS